MLIAKVFAVAKPIQSTFLAHEVLSLEFINRFGTVLHATEVRHFALKALVECALMQGEFSEFSEVNIAFSYDSTLSV